MAQDNQNKGSFFSRDIDLLALVKILWEKKAIVLRSMTIFFVIGVFVAVLSKNEYTASTIFIPQNTSGASGSLSGLAAMVGLDFSNTDGGSEISPILYPQIASSIKFRKELLGTKVRIDKLEKEISLWDYFLTYKKPSILARFKRYTVGLPGFIISKIKPKRKEISNLISKESLIENISLKEEKVLKELESIMIVDVNDQDGYITVSAKFEEPFAAAQLTRSIRNILQKYIIEFKTQRSKYKLNFTKQRFQEKKNTYLSTQKKLANFIDHNQNVNSAKLKFDLEVLQSDYNLAQQVYMELAKQVEAQELLVKQDTPVFTVLTPVFVPFEKSAPKRMFVILFYMFVGFIFGSMIVFGNLFFANLQLKWKKV